MALTKAEIAEALFNQLGLNKREARELVDLFFEEIRAALATGGQVKLFRMPSGRYREACEQGHSITLASCLERSPAPRGVFQDRTHGRLDRAGDCLNTSCHRVGGFVCH